MKTISRIFSLCRTREFLYIFLSISNFVCNRYTSSTYPIYLDTYSCGENPTKLTSEVILSLYRNHPDTVDYKRLKLVYLDRQY
jgi:hypothetical protein